MVKMRMLKRLTSCFLAAIVTAGLFCGCQRETAGGGTGIQQSGESTREDGSGEEAQHGRESLNSQENGGGSQARGRFGETELELPAKIKEQSFVYFGWGKDDELELYTAEWDSSGSVTDVFCYVFRDGVWEEDEEWAGNAVLKEYGLNIATVTWGKDGFCYLGGTDEQYTYHLLKMLEDGTAQELLQEVFLPEDGKEYGLIPPKIEVLANGNLLVYAHDEVYLYSPEGVRLSVMSKDFTGSTNESRGFCEGEEFVTVQGGNLVRYELQTGKTIETASLEEVQSSREGLKLFGDGSGGVYAAGETGLAHLNRGGTLWEILIDGSLNHLGMRSLYLQFFFAGKDGDYYGAFTSDGDKGTSIFHYVYDPDMLSVPPTSITVYSLKDHSTVRQAASQFQSEHPEVKVELRTAVENGESAGEEVIQSLNTELLSGKGADVLILDGLPARSYWEKGVLMDMRELIDEMEGSGELINNLMEGFRQEDGAIYQVPAKMAFFLAVGEKDAVDAYSGLKGMAGYSGEKPLIAPDNYENILRKVAHLGYQELFVQGKITRREGLIEYLETVKTLGEASGSKVVFTSVSEMEEKWVSNTIRPDGVIGTSMNYDAGMCASGIERLDGYGDLCIPAEVYKHHPESVMAPLGKLYLPSNMAGINRSTENADLAKEFIRCLLSYEVQKENLYDGFPVNKKALKSLTGKDTNNYVVGVSNSDGSYYIQAEWPEREVREEVAAMIEDLSIPVMVDETVMNMIVEDSGNYFEGKENVQQAAEKILRKLSIYLSE